MRLPLSEAAALARGVTGGVVKGGVGVTTGTVSGGGGGGGGGRGGGGGGGGGMGLLTTPHPA